MVIVILYMIGVTAIITSGKSSGKVRCFEAVCFARCSLK